MSICWSGQGGPLSLAHRAQGEWDAVVLPEIISNNFLEDLAMVLCVAAVTTVIFQAIRQPVVLGYLIAGWSSDRTLRWLFADPDRIHTISELGVILLMFALGLEFSVRRLLRLGSHLGLHLRAAGRPDDLARLRLRTRRWA